MSHTALVICPSCDGEGSTPDGRCCGPCLGQRHIAVDRAPDGGIPDGFREWIPPLLLDPTTLPAQENHARPT